MSGNQTIKQPPENGQNIHRPETKCVQEETKKISNETLQNKLKNDIKGIIESVENSMTRKSPVKRFHSAIEDVNRGNKLELFSDTLSVFDAKKIAENTIEENEWNNLQCEICQKIFSTVILKRHHVVKKHKKNIIPNPENQAYEIRKPIRKIYRVSHSKV